MKREKNPLAGALDCGETRLWKKPKMRREKGKGSKEKDKGKVRNTRGRWKRGDEVKRDRMIG